MVTNITKTIDIFMVWNFKHFFFKFDTDSIVYIFVTFQEKIVGWSTIQMLVLNTMVVWFLLNGLVGCTTKQIFHQQRYENDIFWFFKIYFFNLYFYRKNQSNINGRWNMMPIHRRRKKPTFHIVLLSLKFKLGHQARSNI